jgi:hypothetical protein
MNPDPEQTLRTLRWRDPPPAFLKQTLELAMREQQKVLQSFSSQTARQPTQPSNRLKPLSTLLLAFIPRPLRLPLAACWLLALYFRLTTPEAIPQSTLENYAKLPPMKPAQLIAHRETTERLANELAEQRRGPIPPL